MIDWLSARSDVIGLAIGFCTLLVWAVYAPLLHAELRRRRRPSLFINRGQGRDLDSLCIVGNLSENGIFVRYVIVEIQTASGTVREDVTDREISVPHGASTDPSEDASPSTGSEPADVTDREVPVSNGESAAPSEDTSPSSSAVSELTRQDALKPNDAFHVGRFRDLVEHLTARDRTDDASRADVDGARQFVLTVRIIAAYGPEDRPVGAERAFRVTVDGDRSTLVPETWYTRHLSSRSERRVLEREMRSLHHQEFEAVFGPAPGEDIDDTSST